MCWCAVKNLHTHSLTEHFYKCNRLMPLQFKGLMDVFVGCNKAWWAAEANKSGSAESCIGQWRAVEGWAPVVDKTPTKTSLFTCCYHRKGSLSSASLIHSTVMCTRVVLPSLCRLSASEWLASCSLPNTVQNQNRYTYLQDLSNLSVILSLWSSSSTPAITGSPFFNPAISPCTIYVYWFWLACFQLQLSCNMEFHPYLH